MSELSNMRGLGANFEIYLDPEFFLLTSTEFLTVVPLLSDGAALVITSVAQPVIEATDEMNTVD